MTTPRAIESQTFVRLNSNRIEQVRLSCFEDGSAYIEGALEKIYEQHPEAAVQAHDYLIELGFIDLALAKDRDIISKDWTSDAQENRNA